MRQRKHLMDWTNNNREYKIAKYGASNWYDDAYDWYKSYGRYCQRNWKEYRRTQWRE